MQTYGRKTSRLSSGGPPLAATPLAPPVCGDAIEATGSQSGSQSLDEGCETSDEDELLMLPRSTAAGKKKATAAGAVQPTVHKTYRRRARSPVSDRDSPASPPRSRSPNRSVTVFLAPSRVKRAKKEPADQDKSRRQSGALMELSPALVELKAEFSEVDATALAVEDTDVDTSSPPSDDGAVQCTPLKAEHSSRPTALRSKYLTVPDDVRSRYEQYCNGMKSLRPTLAKRYYSCPDDSRSARL